MDNPFSNEVNKCYQDAKGSVVSLSYPPDALGEVILDVIHTDYRQNSLRSFYLHNEKKLCYYVPSVFPFNSQLSRITSTAQPYSCPMHPSLISPYEIRASRERLMD